MSHHYPIAVLLALAFSSTAVADSPNIVVVMCDDLGWGDVGFNGNQVIRTPHLDEMARAGIRFSRFYAASAVCSPTRGSVVTGRHPFRYGIPTANAGHMRADELTLAELLKQRGYRTGHFGKWHLGTLSKTVVESNRGGPKGVAHFSPPWVNGFDVCFSTEAKTPTFDPMWKPAKNASRKSWDFIKDKSQAIAYGTHYWNEHGEIVKDNLDGDDSRVIVDRAVPFIQQSAAKKQPFFAIIWFHTPHLPVVAGPKHAAMYAEFESYKRNYYGCITAMDEQLGRIRKTLGETGVAENTIVTFCSDNGPEGNRSAPGSTGPYRGRKRDLYEGGVRVPALLEWPSRIRAGLVTDYPAVTSDYLPTILEAVGAKLPERPLDGLSLLPVLKDPGRQRPSPIGFQFAGKLAWSDNRFKLVYYPKSKAGKKKRAKRKGRDRDDADESAKGFQLYDLLEDPSESKDLAADHPEIVKRMAKELEAWRKSCHQSEQGSDYTE